MSAYLNYRNDLHQQYDGAIPEHEKKILAAMQAEEMKEANAVILVDEATNREMFEIEKKCISAMWRLQEIRDTMAKREVLSNSQLSALDKLADEADRLVHQVEGALIELRDIG